MPRRRKRPSKLRPKTPSRVKKRKQRGPRGRAHPELVGLGLVALGLFLGSVLYLGWNGGYVGGALTDGLDALVGAAGFALPLTLVAVGGYVVARSELVDVRPFRAGLGVAAFGLMLTLGRDNGGYVGQALGGAVGLAIGATGSTIDQKWIDAGTWEVEIANKLYPAVASLKPLYDPENKKVKL